MSSIFNIIAPTVGSLKNADTASYLKGNANTDNISSNSTYFVQFNSPISASNVISNLTGTASFAYGLPPNAYLSNPFTSSWAVQAQNVQTASYAMNIAMKSLTVNMTAGASYGANSGPFTATITHNLGFKPSIIRWVLVSTVTSGSLFSVGDEVDVFAANGPAPEQHQGGATIYTNTTTSRLYLFASNVGGQISGTVILDRNNAQLAVLSTQWQAKCYYSAF
jgi:hypothetical protein